MVPIKTKKIPGGKPECIIIPEFKLYYRVTLIKQHNIDPISRHVDQHKRREDAETTPVTFNNLDFDKWDRHTLEERQSLQQILLENWIFTCRRLKVDNILNIYLTKIRMDQTPKY